MVIYNHKESIDKESLYWKKTEERTNPKDTNRSEEWTIPVEISSAAHLVIDASHEQDNMSCSDLGEYYVARTIDAMEEWHSKPREGYHVTDVCYCPRQKVFREIDRRPIGAKTVSIYSAGRAIHEAIQLLFLSDKRTFEREKYVEYQDIQGSIDIYDRKHNIPLEFKSARSSDIKEPKSFQVEQLKYYMSILDVPQGYMLYQCLLHFGETPFKAFKISMNAQERKDQRYKLIKEVNSLKRAMEAADPSLARSVIEDPALNWLCEDCPYLTDCKRIQDAATAA